MNPFSKIVDAWGLKVPFGRKESSRTRITGALIGDWPMLFRFNDGDIEIEIRNFLTPKEYIRDVGFYRTVGLWGVVLMSIPLMDSIFKADPINLCLWIVITIPLAYARLQAKSDRMKRWLGRNSYNVVKIGQEKIEGKIIRSAGGHLVAYYDAVPSAALELMVLEAEARSKPLKALWIAWKCWVWKNSFTIYVTYEVGLRSQSLAVAQIFEESKARQVVAAIGVAEAMMLEEIAEGRRAKSPWQ